MLTEIIGVPAMLEQTAEEATELAFACLKYARYLRGENKVHGRTEYDLIDNLAEEIADLHLCFDEIMGSEIVSYNHIDSYISKKQERMKQRLSAGNTPTIIDN